MATCSDSVVEVVTHLLESEATLLLAPAHHNLTVMTPTPSSLRPTPNDDDFLPRVPSRRPRTPKSGSAYGASGEHISWSV